MAGREIYAASYLAEFMDVAWQTRGFHGDGAGRCNITSLIDSLAGAPALVVGSGGTFDEIIKDYFFAVSRHPGAKIFAVNDIGVHLPHVDHFVSLHEDNLQHWAALRADKHKDFKTHSLIKADWCWEGIVPIMPISGLFAMQIAWVMGAGKIILVGCPNDGTKRFFDAKPREDFHYGEGKGTTDEGVRRQLVGEMHRLPDFKAAVRATSGWSKEFFGGIDNG